MGLCLLAALILMLVGARAVFAARAGARSRDESAMIDPVELRRLREQAQARKARASQASRRAAVREPRAHAR
jgi:hypothetical protein